MSLKEKHPDYTKFSSAWEVMRDLYEGEDKVKEKQTVYLPASPAMHLDGMLHDQKGYLAYQGYLTRAVFPDYVSDGIEKLLGLLHQKEANIELPEKMEYLRDSCTPYNESLIALLRRINFEQLLTGRLGLLVDFDSENPEPRLALYTAESIGNWDNSKSETHGSLNMVVLDESTMVRKGFSWEQKEKYRVLQIGNFELNEHSGNYSFGVFESSTFDETEMTEASYRGVKIDFIPFTFVNPTDILPNVDKPPMKGLAKHVLAIYRGEADYRQSLFMQGQDTLVVQGNIVRDFEETISEGDKPVRTGAGAMINVEKGGDAKYIGVSSEGLQEQRMALENDRKIAEGKAGNLINLHGNSAESGEAYKTRLTAQTASLNEIAMTGAAGLENSLKQIAKWIGANPDEVKVEPNLEFADFQWSGDDLVKFMTARTMGAPISKRSIHSNLVERGLTKLTYEQEIEIIEQENMEG